MVAAWAEPMLRTSNARFAAQKAATVLPVMSALDRLRHDFGVELEPLGAHESPDISGRAYLCIRGDGVPSLYTDADLPWVEVEPIAEWAHGLLTRFAATGAPHPDDGWERASDGGWYRWGRGQRLL